MVKVMFVEPPKDYWFVMGEYLPPPYGLLQLAGYLETKMPEAEIQVLDCQAMSLDWKGLEKKLESLLLAFWFLGNLQAGEVRKAVEGIRP